MKLKKKLKNKVQVVKKVIVPAAPKVVATSTDQPAVAQFSIPKTRYIEAVGRRKVATARVRLYEGTGDFVVNEKLAKDYFHGVRDAVILYSKPFELTATKGKFAVTAHVNGGGMHAQLDAVLHGLARTLVIFNPEFKIFLKSAGLLTRDDRMKETRKIGMGGKARRKRQSPKR
jgi:small subunit ribosomal protein S9